MPLHTGPDEYNLDSFDDPDFLSTELRYDLPKLGRLDGLDIVHLPRVVFMRIRDSPVIVSRRRAGVLTIRPLLNHWSRRSS